MKSFLLLFFALLLFVFSAPEKERCEEHKCIPNLMLPKCSKGYIYNPRLKKCVKIKRNLGKQMCGKNSKYSAIFKRCIP